MIWGGGVTEGNTDSLYGDSQLMNTTQGGYCHKKYMDRQTLCVFTHYLQPTRRDGHQ